MKNEPIALFKQYDKVIFNGGQCHILLTYTYDTKTDQFLDEACYTVKSLSTGDIYIKVSENLLNFSK